MNIKPTARGFDRGSFQDAHGEACSLQESSSLTPHIWLGIDEPRIMDCRATPVEIPKPEGASIFGRMHLTQDMVRDLLPALHCFVETGELQHPQLEDTETDETQHPQWKEWLAWYGHHYTTHVPMHRGRPSNADTLLSWRTWQYAHDDKNGPRKAPDLNREWKFSKGCDCGCNDPSFTEPLDALRFLMHRMNFVGAVSKAVGDSYAWDIMQILKRFNAVESGEVPMWNRFGDARPPEASGILWIDTSDELVRMGLGFYTEEDREEWRDDQLWISYDAVRGLPVNQKQRTKDE